MRRHFSIIILFLVMAVVAKAEIKLPSLMSDGMVLQQQSSVNIWGKATPGSTVRIAPSWTNVQTVVVADGGGKWLGKVKTPVWGGPYEIAIQEGETEPVTITDVMIGEVWVCSGQSNMQFPLSGFTNQPCEGNLDAVMTAGKYPQVRCFMVGRAGSQVPREDCKGCWAISSFENAPSFSAVAYFFARHLTDGLGGIPVGVIVAAEGGSRIECWMDRETIEKVPPFEYCSPLGTTEGRLREVPVLCYNAMIVPIQKYTAKGFCWYQGEASKHIYPVYPEVLKGLVGLYRDKWGNQDMPFYAVQIAPYDERGNPDGIEIPLFVEAQLKARKIIPHYDVAPTTDAGRERLVHPAYKETVGKRLALLALCETYGFTGIPATGPIVSSITFVDGKAEITFENAPLGVGEYRQWLKGLEIAGSNRRFYPADCQVHKNEPAISASSKSVPNPVAVRYAFRNWPADADLKNTYGLPAFPFRSDNWDMVY